MRAAFKKIASSFNRLISLSKMPVHFDVSSQSHLKKCGDIFKSPNDRRDYRPLTLDNGIRVLLISDKQQPDSADTDNVGDRDCGKTEKLSAAGLCISVGSFCDPSDLPGLTHFLEHMVFMGSSKYPDENDFEAFLGKHGGHSNAYTDVERTVFYFEVQQAYFEGALDRFAHFFSDSLLKVDTVDREIEAVDKEFCMAKLSDGSRLHQIYATLAKPDHPMGKFMWGNSETLKHSPASQGLDVHSRLIDVYHRLYSSRYMTLALQSKDSLDDMEKWTKTSFAKIKDNLLPAPSFSHLSEPFDTPQFYKLCKVVPVKKMHQIELFWCLPPTDQYYHVKPLHYLGWLLGHEGKGSLLAYLKKRNWAISLSSGNCGQGFSLNSTMSSFTVSIKLTDSGFQNLQQVLDAIFAYVKLLQNSGPQEHIYKQIQTIEENDFRFLEQTEPTRYITDVCENMQLYPPEEYLTGDVLMFRYDPELIARLTAMLRPDKVNISLISDEYKASCDQKEYWFGTPYSHHDISPEWIKKWEEIVPGPLLHLPAQNEFIATDFSLRERDELANPKFPVVISASEHSRLYFRQDDQFKVPKAHFYFHLMTPYIYKSARNTVLLDLYINLLQYNLSEVAYDASVAQLSYAFRSFETGMTVQLAGFNHKLPKLFDVLLDYAVNFSVEEDSFVNMRVQLKKTYHNLFIRPELLVRDAGLGLIKPVYWSTLDKYAVIDDVTREDLATFVRELYDVMFIESYISGNVTRQEALSLERKLVDKLSNKPLPADQIPKPRVYELKEGEAYCRIKSPLHDDENCIITNYYQVGPGRDVRSMCFNEMLVFVMEEPCFNILRTKHQLGYDVRATNRNTDQVLAFCVTVCSRQSKFNLDQLDDYMEKFIVEFGEILTNMPDAEFNHQLQALINLKRCEDSNMKERVDRDWNEILTRRYMFNKLDLEIDELSKLTRTDMLDYYRRHSPFDKTSSYSKLSVQVEANPKEEESSPDKVAQEKIDDGAEDEEDDDDDDSGQESGDDADGVAMDTEESYTMNLLHLEGKTSITNIAEFKQTLKLYEHIKVEFTHSLN